MDGQLESEEAARRLGVKLPTLYAYVSRGLLTSQRAADGKRSLFDLDQIEALARRSRGGRQVETRLATVTTAITQLRQDGPYYRGKQTAGLATTASYEEVAALLWEDDRADWEPRPLLAPAGLSNRDLLRWAVVMAGAGDPLRADLRSAGVVLAAGRLISTMVDVLPVTARGPVPDLVLKGDPASRPEGDPASRPEGDPAPRPEGVAARLAARLAPGPVSPELVGAVNAALVVLADHELATSTLAVRMAASTRADLYDAVLAGLGTFGGPLHGGASQLVHQLLADAAELGAEQAADKALRWMNVLPGFGHTVYVDGDPRAQPLLDLFDQLADEGQREVVASIRALADSHHYPAPNVDLGIGALVLASGMAADAGQSIFALARMAGWTAHYLE
ncbi:MAG TPA: citrate synthase, partial [Acidimicrobiales bacterium]|nr:citrate synthase [Acidimicrobiales bacterium]